MTCGKGRPKSDNPKTDRLYIRVSKEEKENIQNLSKKYGYGLRELIYMGLELAEIKNKIGS